MVKLNYTNEMQKQDELWKSEKEDLDIMEYLFNQIILEARELGFNGYVNIYQANGECICEVYDNKEEYQKCCNGEIGNEFIFGYCKPLIACLEKVYLK